MPQTVLNGVLLDESVELSFQELCDACAGSEEWIVQLVEEGALEPLNFAGQAQQTEQWRFTAISLHRAQTARRLQRDLQINPAGVALALDLLEQIDQLQTQLHCLQVRNHTE
jgi:chaperone modulatory protein CbpM